MLVEEAFNLAALADVSGAVDIAAYRRLDSPLKGSDS